MTREELSKRVDEFVKKYTNLEKGYPSDSSYKGECLSIVKLYIKEVFGIDAPPSGNNSANGYWTNFPNPLPTIFEKVTNTPIGVPQKGDIPIWNTNVGGGFGHIDIFISGDPSVFTGFDQNWNGRYAHLQRHDYTNVVGWLAVKIDSSAVTPPPSTDESVALQLVKEFQRLSNSGNLESAVRALLGTYDDFGKIKAEFENYKKTQEIRCNEAVESAKLEVAENWRTRIESANLEIETLKTGLAENLDYRTLFSIAWKKFWSLKKAGDNNG